MKENITILLIIYTCLFFGCKKDNLQPNSSEFRIKKVILQEYNASRFHEFEYEGDKLIKILWYQSDSSNDEYHNKIINYEGNKIIKEHYELDPDLPVYDKYRTEYIVASEKVVQITHFRLKGSLSQEWDPLWYETFQYDKNKLIKSVASNIQSEIFAIHEIVYKNDSTILYNHYRPQAYSDDSLLVKMTLSYKAGLLRKNIFIGPYGHTEIYEYFYNKLGRLVEINYDFGSTIKLEYNSDGLLSKQVINYGSSILYYYENGKGNAELIWHNPLDYVFIEPREINLIRK